jgi:hypothetical protein
MHMTFPPRLWPRSCRRIFAPLLRHPKPRHSPQLTRSRPNAGQPRPFPPPRCLHITSLARAQNRLDGITHLSDQQYRELADLYFEAVVEYSEDAWKEGRYIEVGYSVRIPNAAITTTLISLHSPFRAMSYRLSLQASAHSF